MPCPSGVDIPGNFSVYNNASDSLNIPDPKHKEAKDYKDKKKAFLKGFKTLSKGTTSDLCTKCNACVPKCPQHIRIPDKMQMLTDLKSKTGSNMHNTTDVDSCQRAIRAIEIETYNLEHPTPRRELPPVDSIIIGIDIDRELRREKITRRLKTRLDHGMVEEVRALLDEGIPAEDLIYYGLEYKFLTEYLTGQLSYDEMFQRLEIAIHQFAKRQMTWFRGMERRGFKIHWISATLPMEEKIAQILSLY